MDKNPTKVFAIYSRKSKFTGKGESIENQIEMCKEYIKTHFIGEDYEIMEFEDEGYSGKNLERPEFQRMKDFIDDNKINYVIVYKLDRISRSVSDFSNLIEYLREKNVHFISVKESFDTTTPMGRAMMFIASVFAQLERETTAERVRDNMFLLARTGRWLGGTTPLGYVSTKEEIFDVEGKPRYAFKLKAEPKEIEVVQLIFSSYLECFSLSGTCKKLIELGIKSRHNRYYTPIGIKEILQNPIYCIADIDAYNYFKDLGSDICFSEKECSDKFGLLAYNKRNYTMKNAPRHDESKWIIAKGKHKGIIKGVDWVKIQNKINLNSLEKRTHNHSNTHNNYSLLSGMIFCKKCGSRMFAKMRHYSRQTAKVQDKVLYDYICSNKLRGTTKLCNCKNLNGKLADQLICDYILNLDIEAINDFDYDFTNSVNLNNKIEEVDKEIEKIKSQISNLINVMSQNAGSEVFVNHIKEQVESLDNEIKTLEKNKKLLKDELGKANDIDSYRTFVKDVVSQIKNHFDTYTMAQKRDLLELIINRIEWDEDQLHIFIYGK